MPDAHLRGRPRPGPRLRRRARLPAALARRRGDPRALGLNDDIRAKADRFAARGYLALAPDLFSIGRKPLCVLGAFRALFAGKGPAVDVLDAARAELAGRPDCTGKVGIIGFCMGGGFALLAAPRPGFAASAANYGQLPKDPPSFFRGACPVVASYGAKDRRSRAPPPSSRRR